MGKVLANNLHEKQSLDQQQQSSKNNKKDSSIIPVRSVMLYIELIEKLGAKTVFSCTSSDQEETTLFVSMLNNFDDPLQQLTLLDLLNEHFGSTSSNSSSPKTAATGAADSVVLQEWLSSPPMVSPVLQMLQDPILSGAALQYISSILINTNQQTSQDLNTLF